MMNRRAAAIAVGLLVVLNLLVVFYYVRGTRVADDPFDGSGLGDAATVMQYSHPDFQETEQRIAHQIDILEDESLEESLERLNRSGAYYWPGAISEGGAFVLSDHVDPNASITDIERILSSRRFHKVFFELKELGSERSSSLLKTELERALEDYTVRMTEFLEQQNQSTGDAQNQPVVTVTVSFGSFNYEAGESPAVDLTGARLKVLAIVLLMGLHELRSCEPDVDAIVEKALAQHDQFLSQAAGRQQRQMGIITLMQVGLYSPSVLVTGLTGVRPPEAAKDLPAGLSEARSFPLTPYDALASWFDLHRRVNAVQIDDRKGTVDVEAQICTDAAAAHEWLLEAHSGG
ncbi:hypothetical protein Mal4_28420 [Maioricimonas rarisocia]|uniref:Uncharacterized protein n=1 Tax=Maioricimonas rarisocia TaxID=2528026 RepID=A0A517Z7Q7_9PLAN|nr:hypothetical protein [Maioricimonas rarisocia]QDU38513.1 hypothetical protein Mal4_28420 [Maioricimonas rarisocia]